MKTATRLLRSLAPACVIALVSASASAQHAHGTSPYAHGQSAEIPSLTAEEVRELREGDGMGLARAAELNRFPGPRHLLELKAELGLTGNQLRRIEAIYEKMKAQAVAKGETILAAERHLAGLFASGGPTAANVTQATGHLGVMQGELRAIHLLAHIEAARELTPEQVESYHRLRGYSH